jgi:pimeloyl-ACP methyl ester carboxylesterase
VVPDLRHHDVDPTAPPPADLGTTGLLDYVGDLEAEIRALDGSPVIIGHSMGGLLAQILAARGLGRAVVLLTPAAPAGINALGISTLRCFRSTMSRWGFWRRPAKQTFAEAAYGMLHLLDPAEQRAIYERFVYESGRAGTEMGFWFLYRRPAARVDPAAIRCPMLVIGAAEDRITPVTVSRAVAERYRHVAEYREFAGHAHWVTGEPGWEEIAGAIAEWVEGLPD